MWKKITDKVISSTVVYLFIITFCIGIKFSVINTYKADKLNAVKVVDIILRVQTKTNSMCVIKVDSIQHFVNKNV